MLRKEMKIAAAVELYKREEVSISKAAELAGLKTEYGLSIADSECIAVAKMRERVLLSDDKYLGKMAIKDGVEHIYDLLTFLEACIVKNMIQMEELIEIVSLLKERDFYKFSEDDREELFSYFE